MQVIWEILDHQLLIKDTDFIKVMTVPKIEIWKSLTQTLNI